MKNKLNYILIVISIILILCILFYLNNQKKENFLSEMQSNLDLSKINNYNINIGVSGISEKGTIKFNKRYVNPPQIFTQIISQVSVSDNLYGVNIFNVTNEKFEYSKYKISSTLINDINLTKVEPLTEERFNWLAIGV
jgi:hypothetical protein